MSDKDFIKTFEKRMNKQEEAIKPFLTDPNIVDKILLGFNIFTIPKLDTLKTKKECIHHHKEALKYAKPEKEDLATNSFKNALNALFDLYIKERFDK